MIFEGILNIENNFTEILKNLSEYKLFKKNFLDFLEITYDNIENVIIETQYRLSNNGIVDMYIESEIDGENQIYLIEIKIKIDTPLSNHQLNNDYEKGIEKAKIKYLIPQKYMYIDKVKHQYFLEEFIKKLKKEGIYELNQYIKDFVDFYYKFLWINEKFEFNKREIQLMKGEKMNGLDLTKDITVPELVSELFLIVDKLANKVGFVNTKSKVEQNYSYYGYFLKENENIWFGVDFEVWKDKKSPIIIWINQEIKNLDKKIKEKLELEQFEPYEVDNSEKYYIYTYAIEEMENLEKLINKIHKTKEILKDVE